MVPTKYHREQFEAVAMQCGGVVLDIARALNVNRCTVYAWKNALPEVREILDEARENALDIAESQLFTAVKAGDLKAVTFLLSTRGKSRGFTTRTETELSGSVENRAVVYLPDNQRNDYTGEINDQIKVHEMEGIEHQ